MGQDTSKPSPSSTQHVFASETPVRFSPELIEALQASPETDSTRSKDLELHIQSRVHAELARLEAEQTKSLKELEERISATPDPTIESTHTQASTPDQSASLGGKDHAAKASGDKLRDLSRQSVQKEIEELQKKLQSRKLKEDVVDGAVEKARQEVITCLRVNDRRPLDCWREVEDFKREVGRLEQRFLGKVME